jgi:membrane protease YdiL (CAAX protease family)
MPRGMRAGLVVVAVLAVLAGANVLIRFGPPHTGLVVGPAVALALLLKARWAGLTWDDLGLGRRSLRTGAIYAGILVAAVAALYLLGALLPVIRTAFLDARYRLEPGHALLTALLIVPVGTVLLEEVAFRGVLFGLFRRFGGASWASGISSGLFGAWHILPSMRLGAANYAVGAAFGPAGGAAQVLMVATVVGFTAIAGVLLCELRRRSGSLLAAAGLHWATNGLGVLLTALIWTWHPS